MIKELENKLKNPNGYDKLKSFQIGGEIIMQETKQDPIKLIYSLYKLVESGKTPKGGDEESIISFLKENASEVMAAEKEYATLRPEDLQNNEKFMQFYSQFQPQENAQYVAKGAKLKKLKEKALVVKGSNKFAKIDPNKGVIEAISKPVLTQAKGGKTTSKKKKCSCGCDMILTKATGGKVVETCSCKCGGKLKKKK